MGYGGAPVLTPGVGSLYKAQAAAPRAAAPMAAWRAVQRAASHGKRAARAGCQPKRTTSYERTGECSVRLGVLNYLLPTAQRMPFSGLQRGREEREHVREQTRKGLLKSKSLPLHAKAIFV